MCTFKAHIKDIPLKPLELNTLLGNIIDNAFEAVTENDSKEKDVILELNQIKDCYVICVENSGQISSVLEKNIFTKGVSSKGSNHEGLGLYIVKDISDSYNGVVQLYNTKHNSVICEVKIPKN